MTKEQKGKYAELLVLARLIKDGKTIAVPFGNQSGWDVLVEGRDGWEKWQIKTAYRREGRKSIYVDCIRSGDPKSKIRSRQYKQGDFDYLIAVSPETGEMWKFPFSQIVGRRCLILTEKYQW